MASLELTQWNADTSWLLTWRASADGDAFHLVIDPWLAGSQVDYVPLFSEQSHAIPPAYSTLSQLEKDRNIKISSILLSHEFTDHCHEATLKTATPSTPVFGQHHAKNRVDGFKIFDRPLAETRTYSSSAKDSHPLPNPLSQLANEAGWSDHSLPDDIAILYIPTDSWVDIAGAKLHGTTCITFTDASTDTTYSIFYSPHGVPASAIAPVNEALNTTPNHECIAVIQSWDAIVLPLMGQVNLGKEVGGGVVELLQPKYWIRTHDELKHKSGVVGKTLHRDREDLASIQAFLGYDNTTKAVELPSGGSMRLL
ncbi:hypothetical protein EMMF5_004328 [Cystobasidiomycetes sp. EMM_F5]